MSDSLIVEGSTVVGENQARSRQSVKKKTPEQKAKVFLKRAAALRATMSMIAVPSGLWSIQFLFWALGMVSLGLEKIPGLNILYPGQTLFTLSHFLIIFLGLCSLIFVAFVYMAQRVDCWGGGKWVIFCCCFSVYFIPVVNFFPWFGLWMWAVVYMQDETHGG